MSWSTEGFAVDQILIVKNTKTSNGSYRIAELTGSTMQLTSLTSTALSLAEENTANATETSRCPPSCRCGTRR